MNTPIIIENRFRDGMDIEKNGIWFMVFRMIWIYDGVFIVLFVVVDIRPLFEFVFFSEHALCYVMR